MRLVSTMLDDCLHSHLIAELTPEDPDIQILLDHDKEMYSSLHRGKTTLADATYSDSLIKLATAREKTNKLAHTSRQPNYGLCKAYNSVMQDFTDLTNTTNPHHRGDAQQRG
ncbi:hypothetical protein DPMN_153392 [Dreissena polymorpha]|uniref:Uncharacterized protein n=1 Tax=Dreissena polymorpha TaxID=45954 RepID=A0A9D4J9C5_DREPO|nr:hypothetical protein DPMN_153392 [Dreissena polymorpha]